MKTVEIQHAETTFSNDPVVPLKEWHSALLQRHRREGETPALLKDVEAFIDQGQKAGAILTREADRWELQGILDFWVVILHRAGHVTPEATLAEVDEAQAPKFREDQCPYLGLAAFGEIDETRFFGRQQLLDELWAKVTQNPLVAVVGPPGSGASSLIFAGLLPRLKKGEAMPGSQDWCYYPTVVPGSNPLSSLVRTLVAGGADGATKPAAQLEQLAAAVQAEPARIVALVQEVARGKPGILLIDQFEEAFTLCADESARNAFIDALVALIQQPTPPFKLILTMRAAYRGRITRLPNTTFKQCFDQGLLLVKSPEDDELRAMIEQPAHAIGLNLEREVVDELVADVRGEPSATYLLQDTLVRLWALRDHNWITMDAYRKLGGAKFALVQGARQVYTELTPKEKTIAKALLLRLVHVGMDREPVSRRLLRSELLQNHQYTAPDADQVLQALTKGGIVRQSRTDSSADAQVELMHEALIQNWPELRMWLWESWEELRQRQRLTDNAHLWEESGHSANLLLHGGELADAQALADLDPLEDQYVRASISAKLQADKRQKWIYGSVIGALAVVVVVVAWLALAQADARRNAVTRLAALLSSEAEQTLTDQPQLSLLLAAEAVATSPQVDGRPEVTRTLLALQQVLSTTTSIPLRGAYTQVITDTGPMALSSDGAWLAVGSHSGVVHLWNLTSGKTEFAQVTRPAHAGAVTALAFSSDSRWLGTGGEDTLVNLFDLQLPDPVPLPVPLAPSTGAVTDLAFAPSDAPQPWLAVSTTGSVVQQIGLPTAAPPLVAPLLGEQSQATAALTFSPAGQWLATVSVTGTLRVWLLAPTMLPSATPQLNKAENDVIAFSPDGEWLAAASKADTTIYLYRLDALSTPPTILRGSATDERAIGFSPDSKLLAAGGRDGVVRLWLLDLISKATKTSIEPQLLPQRTGEVWALAFGVIDKGVANPLLLLATAGADRAIELWNIDELAAPWAVLYGHEAAVKAVLFAGKSAQVFAASDDGTVRSWGLADQGQAPQDLHQLLAELPRWQAEACRRAGRGFSTIERATYFGGSSINPTCSLERAAVGQ